MVDLTPIYTFWNQNDGWIVPVVFWIIGPLSFSGRLRLALSRLFKRKKKQPEIPVPVVYPLKKPGTKRTVISQRYAMSFSRSAAIGAGLLGASLMTIVVTLLAVTLSTGPVTFPVLWFYGGAVAMEILGFVLVGARGQKMTGTDEGRLALGTMLAWAGRKPTLSRGESRRLLRKYLIIGMEDEGLPESPTDKGDESRQ